MTPGNPMASFRRALPLAGSLAAIQSALALGMAAIILHGPTTATVTTVDFSHTGLGAIIHIGSAFFWAAFAIFLIRITALDQRQQRIDPAGKMTDDPNRHDNSSKQPGGSGAAKRSRTVSGPMS